MNGGLKQTDRGVETLSAGARNHAEWPGAPIGEPDRAAIARELELILASSYFHASKRSQQFLKYVVQYRLDGNEEPLKERLIGTVLYNRPAGYATGDDSVVRVQAGEVRRRLEQYYQAPPADSHVHIDLPLGSYAPEFRWASVMPPANHNLPASRPLADTGILTETEAPAARDLRKTVMWAAELFGILAVAAILIVASFYHKKAPDSVLNQFWSPIFATSKPALICLPKPVFYQPSMALFKKSEKSPGEFDKEVDRMNGRPHLRPSDRIAWGDMVEFSDFGVSEGDVKAAFRLSNLLMKAGKDTELRIGSDYGWDDLHNAPAVVIGAFSNPWSMKITSGLHFSFAEGSPEPSSGSVSPGAQDAKSLRIQEQGAAGRAWSSQFDARTSVLTDDYGLISRLVNSSTGQFVVSVAGITAPGSEAAADVASSQDELQKALRNAPADWYRKNVQIVVKTTVVDGVAGPPEIVAVYVW